ncbi:MAG: glycosyltransferase [Verrucomicrobiae bacterium]|nr:glycosyltransferase [Verrucomicrobiae bacterium]
MKEPIKIAHIVFSLEPGGMENGVVNLSNGLDRQRFETTILCLEIEGAFASRLRPEVRVVPFGRKMGFDRGTVMKLANWLRKEKPDVLHTHNLGPLIYGILGRAISGIWSIPILHGEHGALQGDDLVPKRLRQRRLGYRFARAVHTVSESLRQHLIEYGFPAEKITAVMNGVDCRRFCPAEEKDRAKVGIGFEPGDFVIGLVGRFIPSKRHELLLDAFRILKDSGEAFQSCRLLLMGDEGPAKQAVLDNISSHSWAKDIRWVGHQSDPLPFYQAMDLQAMPSASEGLSNALLEGMACGVPAVAHPACGASEVIEDEMNGWLRSVETPEALSDCLAGIIRDGTALQNASDGARATAESRFSLESMVDGYAALYERLSR